MPPLAATVAAALAVRAGVALARAAQERRRDGRAPDRRLGLAREESVARGLRRTALGQLDLAIETIERAEQDDRPEQAVHEARKALKRLRALLRLLEPELGEHVYARESDVLRDAGRGLARARDADVLLDTLDRLVAAHPGKLEGRGGAVRLRSHLRDERERAWRALLGDTHARTQTLVQLRACRARVAAWELCERRDAELVRPGLVRIYRQGRSRHRRAARGRGERTLAMHSWRKRVKDLRYAAEMLQRREQAEEDRRGAHRRSAAKRRARARERARWLRETAKRADQLGELLGEEHDLAVLGAYVRALPRGKGAGAVRGGRGARRRLLRLIAARRRKLRKQALRRGERLYRQRPKRVARRAAVS